MNRKLKREKDARDRCLPVLHSAKTSPTAHNDYLLQFHPFEQKSKYLDTTTPDDYLETKVPKQWDMGWWEYEVIGYQPPPHPNAPHRQEFSNYADSLLNKTLFNKLSP